MRKFINWTAVFLLRLIYSVFMGGITFSTLTAMGEAFWWALGTAVFFSAFHYHDLRDVLDGYGRFLRLVWLFTVAAFIVGIIWLFVPDKSLELSWLPSFAYFVWVGWALGLGVGLAESVKKDAAFKYIRRLQKWAARIGGY